MSKWHPVIGLEIHVQLLTRTKLFSMAPTAYGQTPNSQANMIDLGLPGTLPILNQNAIDMAILFGLATSSTVNQIISFDRKNYFYPDLPKGYQITQHYHPILSGGHLNIETQEGNKRIRLHHTHLEEDAGKSLHKYNETSTGIDLNRAGTPLLEVVSEPDLRSTEEAVAFLKTLHNLVVSLGICDGNMQEGSFRCDANVSLRASGNAPFGTRVEIKNINSFRFVEKALLYEIERQGKMLDEGKAIKQQTRLYNEQQQITIMMREKEQAHDYRYHADPDIPEITISTDRIEKIRSKMPELPHQKKQRYIDAFGLTPYDANVLSCDFVLANYFEQVLENTEAEAKLAANWVLGPLSALINKHGNLVLSELSAQGQAELLNLIHQSTISHNIGKTVLEHMWHEKASASEIVKSKGLEQITDPKQIEAIIEKVIAMHPKQVEQYLGGADKLFGFFVGKVMQESKGKADPSSANHLLRSLLSKMQQNSD